MNIVLNTENNIHTSSIAAAAAVAAAAMISLKTETAITRAISMTISTPALVKPFLRQYSYWEFGLLSTVVTKNALESLLKLMAHILPKEHCLSTTYKQFLRLLRPQQLQSFYMCPNGCRVYYGELTDAERCPECNARRYRRQPRSWAYRPKRRRLDRPPRRTFKVLPLIPRLKQVLESDRMVDLLTHYHNVTSPSNGYINDLHQTDHWKSLFVNGGNME